jgi:hypothetical protein
MIEKRAGRTDETKSERTITPVMDSDTFFKANGLT